MFIEDERALWRLAGTAKVLTIEFPVKAGGTRTRGVRSRRAGSQPVAEVELSRRCRGRDAMRVRDAASRIYAGCTRQE